VSPTTYRLVVRTEAEAEVAEAALWYETHERGLGREFLRAFRASTEALRRNPYMYPAVLANARRVLLRRFPYSVFYEVQGSEVVVLACLHAARDPDEWKGRVMRL